LPIGDYALNLKKAIACYEAALRVFTKQDYSLERARIQNNLGNVYRRLATGDRAENLKKAIACYEKALSGYSHSNFPKECADAHYNCGLAYGELAEVAGDGPLLLNAREHFAPAAQDYAAIGLTTEATEAAEKTARMDAEMGVKHE
jgi:tetratricopeptide (TPR) repeat protein